jgi:hypothetical protein
MIKDLIMWLAQSLLWSVLWDNYLNVAKENLGTRYASDLCFTMVYAVLQLQKNLPRNAEYFCSVLKSQHLDKETCYYPGFNRLIDSCKDKYETDFTPNPCSPDKFDVEEWTPDSSGHYVLTPKYNSHWWKTETANFDQNKIREIVNVWQTKEDRIAVLDRIERAFDEDESLPF